jgi:hypothetical protein
LPARDRKSETLTDLDPEPRLPSSPDRKHSEFKFVAIRAAVLAALVALVPIVETTGLASFIVFFFASVPLWTIGVGATVAVVAAYVVGALAAREGARRAGRSVTDARQSEQRLALARRELAGIDQAIADRTIEYAELGEEVRETSSLLQLSQDQTAALRQEIERAAKRARKAWYLAVLAFFVGLAFSYVVEWTAGSLKPPWLP